MTIRFLQQPPEPPLAAALARFEETFAYPLGEAEFFRISHGHDYSRFFRAIAPDCAATCLALDAEGEIRGTLGVAIRALHLPEGNPRRVAYLGDLKVRPGPGGGRTLLRLADAVTAWSLERGAEGGYGIAMDGTSRLPPAYTGRLGVRGFSLAGKVSLLRVRSTLSSHERVEELELEQAEAHFRALSAGQVTPLGGDPRARSLSAPRAFVLADLAACGILEDTRRAKRLLLGDGREMAVAHLTRFVYRTVEDGARLLRHVLGLTAAPALFAATPEQDTAAFRELIGEPPGGAITVAPASIYATGLDSHNAKWNISSSEI